MTNKTPLYEQHLALHAKVINFHGWELPLHYGSQIEEHHAVRRDCGLFDVSHMMIVDLLGAGGRQLLRNLLANDVDKLAHTGKALYSCMLNPHGGIIDDLLVYARASDSYRMVLNAANYETNLNWLREHADSAAVGIQVRSDLAMIAIQGPNAMSKASTCLNATQQDALSTLQVFEAAEADDFYIARTGYTGEDGLEIIVPNEQVTTLWEQLISAGAQPCGLGARDSLRLEAGLLLHGQDMDEHTTPLECGLKWTVAFSPENRDFIGRSGLELQQQHGLKRKLVGLILQDKGVMRGGQKVVTAQGENGVITSGIYSPTLEQSIAFARVPIDAEADCEVEIRDKLMPATIVKPRFVKQGKLL